MAEIAAAKLSIDPGHLPTGPNTIVLDVGCGDGRHVAQAVRRGCRTVGIDYDATELRRCRERSRRRADVIVADAGHLPFASGAFDAVICTETLEHLPDDRGAVREIARVLRPGAPLLGAVPSHFTEIAYWRLSERYRKTPGGHVRIYRPPALAALLAAAGLELRSVRYLHFIDSLLWLRYCLMERFRPPPRDAFAAAVALAVATERRPALWRVALREAAGRSRFLRAVDSAGALFWPKSFAFVAQRALSEPHEHDASEREMTPASASSVAAAGRY